MLFRSKQRNIRDILKVEMNEISVVSVILNGVVNDIEGILKNG